MSSSPVAMLSYEDTATRDSSLTARIRESTSWANRWLAQLNTIRPTTANTTANTKTYHAVSRHRSASNMLRLQCIPDSADGVDELPVEALVDLVAQVVDVDVHDVAREVAVVLPHVVQDLAAAQHLPLVA